MMHSTSSAPSPDESAEFTHHDLADYGVARLRDQLFDAVTSLWRRRKAEGWTQKQVAEAIGRDPAWVSRNLRAPGNWTMRTVGELVQGLEGEAEVRVVALSGPNEARRNYDAYEGYIFGFRSAAVSPLNKVTPLLHVSNKRAGFSETGNRLFSFHIKQDGK